MNTGSPLYLHCKSKLALSPLFSGLSDEILSYMLERFLHITWRKGVEVDAPSLLQRFYLIIDGRVKVERIDVASGDRIILFLLGPGDGFDIINLLDDQSHESMTTALDDLYLLSAPSRLVREWISCHPEFNRNFLPYLGAQMRRMEDLAADLAMKDTVTRLARLILRHTLPDRSAANASHDVRLIHDLNQDSLARMIGSTRQVVNKHLQVFRGKGVLNSHSNYLAVSKLEALKEQAEVFLSHE